jgi:hypothetical protein
MACTPALSHLVGEMGHQATWSRSSEGETTTLDVCRSVLLVATGGPEGSQIPLSPMRRCAPSGRRARVSLLHARVIERVGWGGNGHSFNPCLLVASFLHATKLACARSWWCHNGGVGHLEG